MGDSFSGPGPLLSLNKNFLLEALPLRQQIPAFNDEAKSSSVSSARSVTFFNYFKMNGTYLDEL